MGTCSYWAKELNPSSLPFFFVCTEIFPPGEPCFICPGIERPQQSTGFKGGYLVMATDLSQDCQWSLGAEEEWTHLQEDDQASGTTRCPQARGQREQSGPRVAEDKPGGVKGSLIQANCQTLGPEAGRLAWYSTISLDKNCPSKSLFKIQIFHGRQI